MPHLSEFWFKAPLEAKMGVLTVVRVLIMK